MSAEEVAGAVKVDLTKGLTAAEVVKRQKIDGKNELKIKVEPWWKKIIEPFVDIFMAVLFVALLLSLWHGDKIEAGLIGVIMAVNAIIYYIQRFSTERIVRSLKRQTVSEIAVFRGGKWAKVPSVELVVGDIVKFSEGEKIAADCRVLAEKSVLVDESILTGESERVRKNARKLSVAASVKSEVADGENDKKSGGLEAYDQTNMLFAGSFVVGGEVVAVVVRIGNNTEFGQIAALATEGNNQKHQSPVQSKINQLIKITAVIIGVISLAVLALQLWRGVGLFAATQFVLALAVSAVPEGLPVAIAVILALGIQRMAKKRALVTNMRAIETIGAITTIATDKTGTLTENRLSVQDVWSLKNDRKFANLYNNLAAATVAESADPLDGAFLSALELCKAEMPKAKPVATFPFEQKLAMSGNLWHEGVGYRLVVKGAPEQIMGRADLTAREAGDVERILLGWARQGYRVLALAEGRIGASGSSGMSGVGASGKLVGLKTLKGAVEASKLKLVGLVAVADQIRAESKAAIAAAEKAGVRVCMVTGDHRETALAVGRKVGLKAADVYARVMPEQKLELLADLEKTNITAMTGDGVNDVPALTRAHIGIAMGDSTPIVKDAGDMILLDNNFKNIVAAMYEGRTIVENIRRMLVYLLSTNAGEVLTVIGALLMGVPMPLAPLQILWINLVTDSCLVVPLGLEKPEQDIMRKKPLPFNAPLLNRAQVMQVILPAMFMAVLTLGVYLIFAMRYDYKVGATLAFQTLVVVQWARALNMRSMTQPIWRRLKERSWPLVIGLLAAVLCQVVAVATPLAGPLDVAAVSPWLMAGVSAAAFVIMLAFGELQKIFTKDC
jgi:Ca2+-transporting ATPase